MSDSTVNVLKLQTLFFFYFFPLFVILEITFQKKLSVFVILECGLYHEQKRYISMKKCGRNVLKTRRYDSALSTHFSFQPPLNSCGLSQ